MSTKTDTGICKLCQQQATLVDSHIIPNFHYKPLKEKEGLFYILSTDPKKKELKRQKGITEHLLCALRWTPKIGHSGSLTQSQKNDPNVQETTSAQSRPESQSWP